MKKMSFKLFGLPAAATIALAYLTMGVMWVSLSDKALRFLVPDSGLQDVLEVYKGWFYVILTSLLLYAALKRINRHINQTHEALMENEERLRLIFEQAADGILLLKEDLTIVDCNSGTCGIFGVDSPDDLAGRNIMEFSAERQMDGSLSSEVVEELRNRVMNEPLRFYWQHVQPSGALVDVEVSCGCIRLEGGVFFQAVVRDVTERLRFEEARAREERKNRLLLELHEKAQSLPDKELYDLVLEHAVSVTGSEVGFLHLVSEDQDTIALTTWSSETLKNCTAVLDDHYPLEQAGNWGDCVRLQQTVIYNDYPNSPNQHGLPEGHAPLRRYMGVPVAEGGKVRLVLGIANKEAEYDETDAVQIQLVANELHKIMNQRRLARALHASEETLSEAQRIAHVGSWSLDLVDNKLEWSDEVYRIFELDPEELPPSFEGFLEVIHPDDRDRVQATYVDSLEKRTPYGIEHRLLLKDGTIKYVHVRCETHYSDYGSPLHSIGTVQDITEEKLMHDAVRSSEERFRSLMHQAGDAFFLHDFKGQILDVNESACTSLGYSREELLGMTVADVDAGVESDASQEGLWSMLQPGKPVTHEGEHRRKDGTTLPVEVRIGRLELGGEICILALARDISDRKGAEQAEAREQERLKFIFDVLPIGISLNRVHGDGHETRMINDAHLRIAGLTREQDTPENWRRVNHPDNPDDRDVFTTDANGVKHFSADKRYVHLDGRIAWVFFSRLRRILDDGGYEDLCTVVDITERKQAEVLLFKREQEFRALVENSKYIIVRYDRDCQRTYVNPAYLEMARMPREEWVGSAPESRSPLSPDDAKVLQGVLWRVLDGGEPESVDLPVTHGDKTKHWYHIHVVPEYDLDGTVGSALLTAHDITDRKQSAEELLAAQQQLQYIIDNTRDVIFQIDLEGNYIYGNAAAEEVTGYRLDELLAMNMAELIVPRHLPMVLERLRRRIMGDHEPGSYSFEIIHKDGHRLWLELTTSGVYDAEDHLLAVQGIARDITERKRMEEALEKRIVALTRPLDHVDDLVFEDLFDLEEIQHIQDQFAVATGVASGIIRPDGSPITRPTNFTRLCGDVVRQTKAGCANCKRSDILLGRHHPDGPVVQPCLSGGLWDAGVSIVVGGKHVASWLIGQVRDETQTEEDMRAYAREIGVDETEFLEAFREVPQMSRERFGQIAEALYTLVNQLSATAYMNMQQARFIADEKVRTKELSRLSAAIQQTGEVVLITNTEGRIEYVNPAFETVTGYSREEALGRNPRILKSGVHCDSYYKNMWKRISSGAPWSGQLHNKRKDGNIYIEEATISPVFDHSGSIVNYVAVKRDITNLLKLEEQFHQSQKMEAIGRLASGVAHDFNNILQTILGFCGVLLMETEERERLRQDVLEIQNAAKRAGCLTRQLLAFSRNQPTTRTLVDLNQAIAEQVTMLRRLLGEHVSLVYNPEPDAAAVVVDPSQMVQVLMNLVVNARDAMPDGGQISISTSEVSFEPEEVGNTSRVGRFACMAVTDTGTGIKDEVLEHLFEPFFTTKPAGQGTGLGLAITYGIIERHRGWIDVKTVSGEGTTFMVYLPVADREAMPVDSEDGDSLVQYAQRGHHKRILLVEDDPQVRSLVRLILEDAGYGIVDAMSANMATEVFGAQDSDFDLLLIDAVLPDGSGIQLADTLRKVADTLSVIVLSAYGEERVRADEIAKRGYFFLKKPFEAETLLNTVQTAIGLR